MGHHFVPQRYLKGFQSPEKPAWIWAFDKKAQTAKHLPIKQVAQARWASTRTKSRSH